MFARVRAYTRMGAAARAFELSESGLGFKQRKEHGKRAQISCLDRHAIGPSLRLRAGVPIEYLT